MKKANLQYQRNLTTNSYNQDFVYYKQQKEPSKSPKFTKHPKNYADVKDTNNHSKIQSMKNTLNTLFDPLSQGISKSFNKSVAEYDVRRKTEIPKCSKSVYEQESSVYLNNKLEALTSKLREIAQKPHFSTTDEFKRARKKNEPVRVPEETYIANMSLIQKGSETKEHLMFEQLFSKQTKKSIDPTKSNKIVKDNFSQQLAKSKSKITGSFYDKNKYENSNSNSQTSSLKRQPKNLKNEKSVTTFNLPQSTSIEFELSQRPRGKTFAHLVRTPIASIDQEPTKIKINSYMDIKESTRKSFQQNPTSALPQKPIPSISPKILDVLKPHRGLITSIIINSDGKRFLSSSNDYQVKQSTLNGNYTVLRKHQGRVNVMRMIDQKLYSGGNDCRLRYEKGSFQFKSPVVQVYPHQKQYINVGTSSSIELFNVTKGISQKRIDVRTKFYKLCQKINKDVYFLDNHSLSTIDWRVPFPLINLFQEENFINDWVSDPYTLDFYQVRGKKLICTNNQKSSSQEYTFQEQIKDYCWKKDKVYFLTETELQVFQNKKNQISHKSSYLLDSNFLKPCKLQIKNDLWIYGTRQGNLVVNKFQ